MDNTEREARERHLVNAFAEHVYNHQTVHTWTRRCRSCRVLIRALDELDGPHCRTTFGDPGCGVKLSRENAGGNYKLKGQCKACVEKNTGVGDNSPGPKALSDLFRIGR